MLAAYQYSSNAGTVYQVMVPADFADAIGMTPASGSEPYLDPAIAPRVVNYSSTTVGGRQAVIGTNALFAGLAPTLTVDSIVYTRQTMQGESIPSYQLLTAPYVIPLVSAPGLNGAPGTNGLGFASDTWITVTGSTSGTLSYCASLQGSTLKSLSLLFENWYDAGRTVPFGVTWTLDPVLIINSTSMTPGGNRFTGVILPACTTNETSGMLFAGF